MLEAARIADIPVPEFISEPEGAARLYLAETPALINVNTLPDILTFNNDSDKILGE